MLFPPYICFLIAKNEDLLNVTKKKKTNINLELFDHYSRFYNCFISVKLF